MMKIRLLQAVCTVAMLGAVPAFAQSNPHGSATPPAGQQAMPDNNKTSASDNKTSMAPGDKDGMGMSGHGQKMHRSSMMHRNRTMHATSKTDKAQDSEVDRLNSQSYHAAQQGQAFSGNGSDNASGGMMKSNASGGMGHMSNKGMSDKGMSDKGMSDKGMSGSGTSGSGMSGSGAGTK